MIDHHTFVLCGDGDLMEGLSHEAASLAGTLGLGKLIVLYDDNLISLDGPTELSFTEDVTKRFEAYHWQVLSVADGNDLVAIEDAIRAGIADTTRPTLIRVRTVIGYGSPKAGTQKVHGEALGADALKATKKNLGWPEDKMFYVPDEARKNWDTIKPKGKKLHAEWDAHFAEYKKAYPEPGAEFERVISKGEDDRGLGEADSGLPNRKAYRHAQRRSGHHERDCEDRAGAVWRRGRPDRFDEDHLQGLAQLPRRPEGPQRLLRRARVRHDGGGERDGGARRVDPVRLYLLRMFSDYCRPALRLAALMSHALAVCVHARLGWVGRRRPDAPADRAPDEHAGDSAAYGLPACRRE